MGKTTSHKIPAYQLYLGAGHEHFTGRQRPRTDKEPLCFLCSVQAACGEWPSMRKDHRRSGDARKRFRKMPVDTALLKQKT